MDIEIVLIDEEPFPVVQGVRQTTATKVSVDDSIRWFIQGGSVVVTFPDPLTSLVKGNNKNTPLRDGAEGSEKFQEFLKSSAGKNPKRKTEGGKVYEYKCSVTIGGKEFGWPKNTGGGGEVEVLGQTN